MAAQLFVGSLSRDTTERDLENVFYKHGKLMRCDLKRGVYLDSDKAKGFGFVEYESPKDAEDAIRTENGRRLLGSRIVVEWAKGSVGDRAPRHRDRSRSRDRDFGARPPRRRSPPRGGYDRGDRDRSPPRFGNSYRDDSFRDRRRSISPRRFREDRFDRDRFGGGGRFDRDRGDRGFERRYDRDRERDRFTRRY